MEIKENSAAKSSNSGILWFVAIIVVFIACYAGVSAAKPAAITHPAQPVQSTPPPVAPGGHSIYGTPSIPVAQIDTILKLYQSPAAGQGQTLYDLSVQYGIDDAYPLAFFMHESRFGTQGEAQVTHSLGNLRCIDGAACIDQDRGGYASFASWHDGFQAWFVLITSDLYKGDGLTTVETIIPRYAPTADSNDETAYINAIIEAVDAWQQGKIVF
jgi:hypothetical protein